MASTNPVKKLDLTADLIEGFATSLLSQRFDEPAPTPDCHREWWTLCCSKNKRVAIAAPRGHAKSTAITKAFVLASALFRVRRNILVVSDTYQQAVTFLGEIKREFEVNDDLKLLFGFKELATDREDEIVAVFADGYQFRIKAYGSEQKVRGIIWDGMRPDLIVGDDLENDEMVMNPERREKFRTWMLNALLPTLSKRGIVRIIGTILHMDAYLERLMPKDKDSYTEITELKSAKTRLFSGTGWDTSDGWMSVRYRAHNEDFSSVLWPIKWDKNRFLELQAMFKAQGNLEGYYQEYLNRPIDPTNSFFRKEDFADFHENDYERDWGYSPTYLSVDGAWTTKQKRDWTVLTVGSTDDTGTLYIRHIVRDRMDPKETVETIVRLQTLYKFPIMLIGKGAYEKGVAPFLQDLIRRQGKFLYAEAIPESIDKRLRAQSIRGRMRAGGVKFNKKGKWYPDFEQELLEFDRGTHDDQVDTMALFGLYLDNLMDAPTFREIQDYEYDNEFNQLRDDDFMHGRNLITGY